MKKNYFVFLCSVALIMFSSYASAQDPTTVTDKDGNSYPVVKIGNLVWMAQNLRVTHFNNGDAIPDGTTVAAIPNNSIYFFTPTPGATTAAKAGACTWTLEKTGLFYTNAAANDVRGIAPAGWRMPTESDWQALMYAIGMTAADTAMAGTASTTVTGNPLITGFYNFGGGDTTKYNPTLDVKLKSTEAWGTTAAGGGQKGLDNYGFNAYPVGYWAGNNTSGSKMNDANQTEFWVSNTGLPTVSGSGTTIAAVNERKMHATVTGIMRGVGGRSVIHGFSVRLVKDATATGLVNTNQNAGLFFEVRNDNDQMTITGKSANSSSLLSIFDCMGKQIFSTIVEANFTSNFNLPAKGLYFIRLKNEKTSLVRKVLIK